VITRNEAIEIVLNVIADRPSGPTGEEVLEALGVKPLVEKTSELTFTRECTLCGGGIHVVSGERQRHACGVPSGNA
jgi:hypothetical protein